MSCQEVVQLCDVTTKQWLFSDKDGPKLHPQAGVYELPPANHRQRFGCFASWVCIKTNFKLFFFYFTLSSESESESEFKW